MVNISSFGLIHLLIVAEISHSKGDFCRKSFVGGKWINEGDCKDEGTISSILADLEGRVENNKQPESGAVRLVGALPGFTAGRVEIFHNGTWGAICDDDWDINDAAVICRMLGYPNATDALSNAAYGPGTYNVWLDDVDCVGNESSIIECSLSKLGVYNCYNGSDVSVVCNGTLAGVRLSGNGNSSSAGRVEILYGGVWGTISDTNWDINDASVICKMLGFPKAMAAPVRAAFGKGTGMIWLSEVDCVGNETSVGECESKGWGVQHFDNSFDVSAVCNGSFENVRLGGNGQNRSAGRVEILFAGSWGTICDYGWDINDATIICRMLGFQNATAAPSRSLYGEGSGPIWLSDVGCLGNETSIKECSSSGWGVHSCYHYRDASVICNGSFEDVRLVGNAEDDSAGRVEVLFAGTWGTICDSQWDIFDAVVICTMLGFDGATSAQHNTAYGEGAGPIWLNNVNCTGSEISIADCGSDGWGVHDCNHDSDASVECICLGDL